MSAVEPLARIVVGVVVERRNAESRWVDFIWRPVAVLVGQPDAKPWSVLSDDGEAVTFFAGVAEIALYRTETGYYRDNLGSGSPSLWVVLRPTGREQPYEIAAVTADPNEGEAFTQAGDNLVEALPMPAQVHAVVEGFVAEHHRERPFVKRQRDRADPDTLGRRRPPQKAPKP